MNKGATGASGTCIFIRRRRMNGEAGVDSVTSRPLMNAKHYFAR